VSGPVDPAEAAAALRVILDAVDCGEVEATGVEAAYLAGAADALSTISGQSFGGADPER